MKINALEWFSAYTTGRVNESTGLGLAGKAKSIHKERSSDQVAAAIGLSHLSDLDNKDARDYFLQYAKSLESPDNNIRVGKSSDKWTGKECLIVNFREFTDAMDVVTKPRLYVTFEPSRQVKVEVDFRRDTAGSGSFNSRKLTVIEGNIDDIAEDLIVCIQNVEKLDKLDPSCYPSDWNKKEYQAVVSGMASPIYDPSSIRQNHSFSSKDIIKFIENPKFSYGDRFNYIQALEYMLDKTIWVNADIFKRYDIALKEKVKNVAKYKSSLEGKVRYIWIVVDGKIEWDLGLEIIDEETSNDLAHQALQPNTSYYRVIERKYIDNLNEYPEIAKIVCRMSKDSELYEKAKVRVIHYFSANRNSSIVKNAKERILELNSES